MTIISRTRRLISTLRKGTINTVLVLNCFHLINNFRLAVNNFQKEASNAQLDLVGDSEEALRMQRQLKVWDRKKKKMVALPVSNYNDSISIPHYNYKWFKFFWSMGNSYIIKFLNMLVQTNGCIYRVTVND